MAESRPGSVGAVQLPDQVNAKTNVTIKTNTKLPRRKLTLIAITVLLNVLLWSSVICLVSSLYQIASDADPTNVPSTVLSFTSGLASIAYILLHTVFSFKQRIWKHQRRNPSTIRKTAYVAVRLAVTLCILWLLTCGWNMIMVARRPFCLSNEPSLPGWEAGTTCHIGLVGVAFAFISLAASCTLFGMLAVVRRPFEAHLLKHGYREPINPAPTPAVSCGATPSRNVSFSGEHTPTRRISTSTYRSTLSYPTNTDVNTLDLNSGSPPSTIHTPYSVRSASIGIFTSKKQPPPVPPNFGTFLHTSFENSPPIFYPTVSHPYLAPPPRMSALVSPSGFVPLSIPLQYPASAWRAVHPPMPSPLGPIVSRSQPHLSHKSSGYNFSYRNRFSRSSVSLTKPHRLSSTPPTGSVAWSSRSGSTGPEDREGRTSPSSSNITEGANVDNKASSNEIAYAILNGTPVPDTELSQPRKKGHVRHTSAPDAPSGAQQSLASDRMAKGWKPQATLTNPSRLSTVDQDEDERSSNELHNAITDAARLVRFSSAELLSKFPFPNTQNTGPNTSQKQVSRSNSDSQNSPAVATKLRQSSSTYASKNPSDVDEPKMNLERTFDNKNRQKMDSDRESNPPPTTAPAKPLTFRKLRSESHLPIVTPPSITNKTTKESPNQTNTVRKAHRSTSLDRASEAGNGYRPAGRRTTLDEGKNKPLPKIAML